MKVACDKTTACDKKAACDKKTACAKKAGGCPMKAAFGKLDLTDAQQAKIKAGFARRLGAGAVTGIRFTSAGS